MLNQRLPDPSRLKIMILSCPKTGNTWLRWLMHYAYRLPIVEVPVDWTDETGRQLPDAFVTHQHLWPSKALVQWLVENDVAVLSTIRHPADTLLSYFHFGQWMDHSGEPAGIMKKDGSTPGRHTLEYVRYSFGQTYFISLAWAQLGAHVVRYEDMLSDPVAELERITSKIAPIDLVKIKAAVLLCQPEVLTAPGVVDPRHLRTATARRWVTELPASIVEAMSAMEPYKSACRTYSYDWDTTRTSAPMFDYRSVDPFRGAQTFDNGEPIGPSIRRLYFHPLTDGLARWPDPTRTSGDSFWNWLLEPPEDASSETTHPPGSYTNLMKVIHGIRPDLQQAFPDPAGRDRIRFLHWFVGRAHLEFKLPFALIVRPLECYLRYIQDNSGGEVQHAQQRPA